MKRMERNLFHSTMLGVSMIFLAACAKTNPSFSLLGQSQTFKQNSSGFNNQLDILWVIDNSPSMTPLQTNLTNNFSSFITNFETKGYDFKMAVTTSDAYRADMYNMPSLAKFSDGVTTHTGIFVILPTTLNLSSVFVTNASQGANGSADERVFSSFRSALNDSLNAGFLRSNSFFSIIILSDEDDFSNPTRCEGCGVDHDYNQTGLDPVSTYTNYLDTLTGSTSSHRRYNVSTIGVLDSACQQQHAAASPSTIIGQRMIQLSNATSGILGSVCDASFANSLNLIQEHIAELSTEFQLQYPPQVNTIVVVVNGVNIPQDSTNGWTYDSTANAIVFHGNAIPPQGATISINFTPTSAH